MQPAIRAFSGCNSAFSHLTKYSPYVYGLRSDRHCRAACVVFECGGTEIWEAFGEEYYADGVDKLRRNSGFDRRLRRRWKKHPGGARRHEPERGGQIRLSPD